MSESNDQAGAPSLAVKAQYLKDLSFENPNAPQAFGEAGGPPQFEVDVNVNARGLTPNNYEVELSVSARARRGDMVAFVVESAYAGVFEIRNVPQDQIEIIMLVECPRLLFPFLRQIVADATRNGNYPPLMLEPIDFFAVYQRDKMIRAQSQGQKLANG
ncbi:MAG: protein-export chaperone SecB [Parvularculaceae bacterium]|nr:protein-export chaperone SecB [Parvularculaceae bacterium]